jgi:LacI family transcriptional regulator
LAASGHDEAFVALVRGMTVPVVTFDQKVPGLDRDFVGSDNRLASAMLTEHLLQLGHRRIAFIAGPAQLHTASERLRGFTETMLSAGVDVDPDLVVDGQFTRLAGYEQAMRLLVRPDRPSAIIGANNSMALAALQAMQELSFDCPGDISLAMIDDVQWSSVITPKITMVVQDTARLGSLVGHRLLHRMMSPEGAAAPAEDFVLTPKFVPGNSCRRI